MAAIELRGFCFSISSVVRGFRVYKDCWNPTVNDVLGTRQELGNREDEYAVAVVKLEEAEETVGHMPREISRVCWYFLNHDGNITCTITGGRTRSSLPQGGLEVPCIYKFTGKKKHVKKLRKLFADQCIVVD